MGSIESVAAAPEEPGIPMPRIVSGRVGHRRLAPVGHGFVTQAFYVQVPLRSLARQMVGGAWGGWAFGVNRPALLSLQNKDHGDGGPLLDWAAGQLRDHGVTDADGEIWLSTFPRMLGYVFKPVSFWYCERNDGSLSAVIAEVNNTFGDRHVYVLPCGNGYRNGQTLQAEKAFYVSPFFQVDGHYRFRFHWDGASRQTHDLARIEYHRGSGPALITHVSGEAKPLTPAAAVWAWLRYPAFSLGVILRIHWHALLLWRKGLRLVPRPARP